MEASNATLAANGCAMDFVVVSPEMTMLLGAGPVLGAPLPPEPAALTFTFGGLGACATVSIAYPGGGGAELERPSAGGPRLVLMVQQAALRRLFGESLDAHAGASFHLTPELRAITIALRDCAMRGETRTAYRLAKSIELLCDTVLALQAGALVALSPDSALSLADSRRVLEARRLIDERWAEKLTLDLIARACGLNRAKLTRGFREVFACTVTEAICDRRLAEASRKLLTTDKPVSSIGYESGYLNNASFARAFSRRFGVSPSEHRACHSAVA